MPEERQKPPQLEAGEPLKTPPEEYEDEDEIHLRRYYPNLSKTVKPRDWDEPPWGHRTNPGSRRG